MTVDALAASDRPDGPAASTRTAKRGLAHWFRLNAGWVDPADPVYAALAAAVLGLVPFCIPLIYVLFQRVASCSLLWLRAGPPYLALLIGAWLGRRIPARAVAPAAELEDTVFYTARVMLVASSFSNILIAVGGAAIYGIQDPLTLRDFYGQLPGLSLITQYHVPFLVPFLVLADRRRRPWKLVLALVLVALVLRATLVAERLGFIEAVVGMVIAWGLSGRLRLGVRHLTPFAALGALGWFGTELSRNVARQVGSSTILQPELLSFGLRWIAERFVGYYADSANKFLFATEVGHPHFLGEAFLATPLRALQLLRMARGYVLPVSANKTLATAAGFGFDEFTNPGGLTAWYLDWGYVGTTVALLLVGLLVAWLFVRLRRGALLPLVFYCPLLVAIAETPRIFYIAEERTVVPMVMGCAALVAVGFLRRSASGPPLAVGVAPVTE